MDQEHARNKVATPHLYRFMARLAPPPLPPKRGPSPFFWGGGWQARGEKREKEKDAQRLPDRELNPGFRREKPRTRVFGVRSRCSNHYTIGDCCFAFQLEPIDTKHIFDSQNSTLQPENTTRALGPTGALPFSPLVCYPVRYYPLSFLDTPRPPMGLQD